MVCSTSLLVKVTIPKIVEEVSITSWGGKIMKAKYLCLKCNLEWEEELKGPTECPKCHFIYIKWLNYKELFNVNAV